MEKEEVVKMFNSYKEELVKTFQAKLTEMEKAAKAKKPTTEVDEDSIAEHIARRLFFDDEFSKRYYKNPESVIKDMLEGKKYGK